MLRFIRTRMWFLLSRRFVGMVALCAILFPVTGSADGASQESYYDIALKAYIYAYPMVLLEVTRSQDIYLPDNTLYSQYSFPDASFKKVVSPNLDTLYSEAWIDLSNGPVTLTLPDMGDYKGHDRYYLVQLMDAWTDTFADMGTRTSGNSEQVYTIVGPHWKGEIPGSNLNIIKSPTNRVWLVVRIFCDNTNPEDIQIVNDLQNRITLTKGQHGKGVTKGLKEDHSIACEVVDPALTPPEIVTKMSAQCFYETFANIMMKNPPHQEDWPMLALLQKIGIYPGTPFDFSGLSNDIQEALVRAAADAPAVIQGIATMAPGITENNFWQVDTVVNGSYGASYALRAFVALVGLGANLPDDAVYSRPLQTVQLDGSKNYKIHFANKEQFPPVADEGFWSITLYDAHNHLVANSISKYAIRSVDAGNFVTNDDGSVDIYIQNQPPAPTGNQDTDSEIQANNWLPAPTGQFVVQLRMYWPLTSVVYGTSPWQMPAVEEY